jgi:hypothetical protein
MPSGSDFFNKLKDIQAELELVNGKLDDLKASTDSVHTAVQQVNTTLTFGFGQLITLGIYTNQALFQNAKQNDTIICILEKISKNTCDLVNESHTQTGLQTVIQGNTTTLAELYAATHANAAQERERLEELRKQIEECCPPKPPEPVCGYQPCPAPRPLGEPPQVEQPPVIE